MSQCCSSAHSAHQQAVDYVSVQFDARKVAAADKLQAMAYLADLAEISEIDDAQADRLFLRVPQPSLESIQLALSQWGYRMQASGQEQTWRIEAMDCPTEERLIRDRLGRISGIQQLRFNLIKRELSVSVEQAVTLEHVEQALIDIGLPGVRAGAPVDDRSHTELSNWRLAGAVVLAAASEVVHWFEWLPNYAVALLAVAAIALGGWSVYRKGWLALRQRTLNINALMSIAVTGAVLIGQWPEAAMVIVLFALAERIEARSLVRARKAIEQLLLLAPDTATVKQPDGAWRVVDIEQVALGAQVRVRPGERIALDGEVVEGHSSVNQAPITGESLPIDKQVGDAVYAGTINQSGELIFQVTESAQNSTLSKIVRAVEQAQSAQAPTQRFIDRFSRIYTPTVCVLAALVAVLPPLFDGQWLMWIYRALVLLVVACPCALVISTPVTIVSALARAARRGILIKGGVYLEQGRRLQIIAFDKTGTITYGRPEQTAVQVWADEDSLPLAISMAARSDHPVSQALVKAQPDITHWPVDKFSALLGRGVTGVIGQTQYWLGNMRLMRERQALTTEQEALLSGWEAQGQSVVSLCAEGRLLASFAVADTLKPSSVEALQQLSNMGIQTLMLSGDNEHTVQAIASSVGLSEAKGNLLPEHKQNVLLEKQSVGMHVGMVGDGINDAPALAQADIGFAMGSVGSDSAIETADVALMDDDLRKVPEFIQLSRWTHRVLWQNIVLALGVKAIFLVMTIVGDVTLWMAIFADMGVSLLVVFNGLRLLRGGKA